jgi:hypothetical protein
MRMPRTIGIVVLVASLVPVATRALDAAPATELVAEAAFLRDDLPPGGRDLNLSVGVARGEPEGETGEASFAASPRLQLAMALGERVGFTADVGLVNDGAAIDTPGASLKLLLRASDEDTTGLAASLDLLGSTTSLDEVEAGIGLGAIRSFGRLALRAAVGLSSGLSGSPHVHGGVSAATRLASRWRVLGEVVADSADGGVTFGAGPTVKVTLSDKTALMMGALFQLAPAAAPAFTVQLTTAL